jgi:hypothetical protein
MIMENIIYIITTSKGRLNHGYHNFYFKIPMVFQGLPRFSHSFPSFSPSFPSFPKGFPPRFRALVDAGSSIEHLAVASNDIGDEGRDEGITDQFLDISHTCIYIYWLVVWNMNFILHNVWDNPSH